uniref:ribosomal protein L33 n=1 Tax=Cleistocactus hyalacanthus TaxID=2893849 RepID=UPI0030025841|nr:ribosomal protein L33 [Cleistocactus hyalacanthus]
MPESKLFWNVPVVFERVLIKNQGAFLDILLKQKNRHNTPSRLELRKFCPYRHTIRGEIKK